MLKRCRGPGEERAGQIPASPGPPVLYANTLPYTGSFPSTPAARPDFRSVSISQLRARQDRELGPACLPGPAPAAEGCRRPLWQQLHSRLRALPTVREVRDRHAMEAQRHLRPVEMEAD